MRFSRLLVVSATAGGVVLLSAIPALAHVEVDATPAQALAVNATISVKAESESTTAGIVGSRIQLPSGLLASDIRLVRGPTSWRMAASGQVVEVRGPDLPVGEDLAFSLGVRQLPQTPQLVLKMVQSYSDGRKDSWIEVPSAGGGDPEFPAPIVELSPAAAGATVVPRATPSAASTSTAGPTSSAGTTPSPSAATGPPAVATAPAADDSSSAVLWIGGAILLGLATAGVIVWRRRRTAAG